MTRESLWDARNRGRAQMPYAHVARSNWGAGDEVAEYSVGDLVYVPLDCIAVIERRCDPGLHRVESCFSIDEGPSFYYRICPAKVVGGKGSLRVVTDWETCSDRLHVVPGEIDCTDGWLRFHHEVTG